VIAALVLLCAVLTGCSSAIQLRHPDGRTAQCGPYHVGAGMQYQLAQREARCLDDYERQGFVRVP
jgi:hypothetical protein